MCALSWRYFLCAMVTFFTYKVSILNIHFALTVILRIETSSDCHDPHVKSALLTRDCMNGEHNLIQPPSPRLRVQHNKIPRVFCNWRDTQQVYIAA